MMEIVTMLVCLISLAAPSHQEFCATQDVLMVRESTLADYCELKQMLLDKELAAGNPYKPAMSECRLYVPEQDEERLAPLEFEDEHD